MELIAIPPFRLRYLNSPNCLSQEGIFFSPSFAVVAAATVAVGSGGNATVSWNSPAARGTQVDVGTPAGVGTAAGGGTPVGALIIGGALVTAGRGIFVVVAFCCFGY